MIHSLIVDIKPFFMHIITIECWHLSTAMGSSLIAMILELTSCFMCINNSHSDNCILSCSSSSKCSSEPLFFGICRIKQLQSSTREFMKQTRYKNLAAILSELTLSNRIFHSIWGCREKTKSARGPIHFAFDVQRIKDVLSFYMNKLSNINIMNNL